jgi:Ca-activated chloride channel homolog
MKSFVFSQIQDPATPDPFEKLFKIFKEIMLHTNGDVDEAISWLTELDKQYKLTTPDYGIADFVNDLKEKGFIEDNKERGQGQIPTSKMELALRKQALEDIFGKLKKSKQGKHNTGFSGRGDEHSSETKPFEFGDSIEQIAVTNSLKNAQINHGLENFVLTNDDLEVHEQFYQAQMSTVVMIDISHSMILYGEDRITPAKKVAMALSELIMTRFPKDTLDIIVFGDDSWRIDIKDLPYLQVGEYHTNTVAGLELAMEILKKKRNPNKQIFMITDGKPTCIKKGKNYYKNSWGLDQQIITRTLNLAAKCRKQNIPVTTFMIARDPYLIQFVDAFTQANGGKAIYSSLSELGEFVFLDYKNSKRKRKN